MPTVNRKDSAAGAVVSKNMADNALVGECLQG